MPHLARLLDRWQSPSAGVARRPPPEYAALATAVRGLLRDGRLALGVRLPAERELAAALGVSRTTVTAAYRELRDSGHLTSRRGAGSWTALPAGHRVGTSGLWTPERRRRPHRPGLRRAARARRSSPRPPPRRSADLPPYTGGAGYHPAGLPALREAIADRFTARGLPTDADQIMITTGVAARRSTCCCGCSSRRGSRVLVESPTYPNVLAALRRAPAPGSAPTRSTRRRAGTRTLLLGALRSARPALAYLIPDFHNPTGHLMPAALRERLPSRRARRPAPTWSSMSPLWTFRLDGGAMPPPVAVVRPARAGAHDRRHEQAVLGRPAHRLDPRARHR